MGVILLDEKKMSYEHVVGWFYGLFVLKSKSLGFLPTENELQEDALLKDCFGPEQSMRGFLHEIGWSECVKASGI